MNKRESDRDSEAWSEALAAAGGDVQRAVELYAAYKDGAGNRSGRSMRRVSESSGDQDGWRNQTGALARKRRGSRRR